MQKKTKIEENKLFFNRWSGTYDNWLFQFWMKRFHDIALQTINNKQGAILDVSCGSGELLSELAWRGFQKLHGVDIADKMLSTARKKLPGKVKLYEADVLNLPFASHTFDYVASTEAFHHYPEQEQALLELKRVLKKGGSLIVADINFFIHPVHWLFEKFEPGCVKVNSAKEMRQLFNRVGLKIEKQKRTFLFSVTTVGTLK